MADVTFIREPDESSKTVSTDNIQVVKVYSDKVRIKEANENFFATLASFLDNLAILLVNDVPILGYLWTKEASFKEGLLTPNPFGVDSSTGDGFSVTTLAEMGGSDDYGVSMLVDSTDQRLLTFENLGGVSLAYIEFWFDINSLTMGENNSFNFLVIDSEGTGAQFGVLYVNYTEANGYRVGSICKNDVGGNVFGALKTLADTPIFFQVALKVSSADGENDGYFKYWMNGVEGGSRDSLDNDTQKITDISIGGQLLDAGTSGTVYFDDFNLRK